MLAMEVLSGSNCRMATTMATTTASCHSSCRSSTCPPPPWLQAAITDIEQQVKALALDTVEETDKPSDSFAERAENYYEKRPQLLSLLRDLHHRYLCLADRYSQVLSKPHIRRLSIDTVDFDDSEPLDCISSDAESTLSFQQVLPQEPELVSNALEYVVKQLVGAFVERELLLHELCDADLRGAESARKAELQGSLLEVLESERLVLLGENARLGLQAAAAEEEARVLADEVGYVRRRAGELARCVVKLREDHKVCLLGRKIEGLQAQIFALERRNRECYEAMARREMEKAEARIEMDRLRAENIRLREAEVAARTRRRRTGKKKDVGAAASWWDRIRNTQWALCGSHVRKGDDSFWYC